MSLFVMLPTYNEAENVVPLLDALFGLGIPDLEVVVVDDSSPDGTWKLVQDYAAKNPRLHLLLRTKKRGRGAAGAAGFRLCLDKGADLILEMDADFSHHPRHIPEMLRAIQTADLVLGSRSVAGGSDSDRGLVRQMITKLAGLYVRKLLSLTVRDVSSGFRLFRRRVLEVVDPDEIIAVGPPIVTEVLFKAARAGFRIVEVPISFEERRKGQTKLDWVTLLESLVMVLRLRKMARSGRIPAAVSPQETEK